MKEDHEMEKEQAKNDKAAQDMLKNAATVVGNADAKPGRKRVRKPAEKQAAEAAPVAPVEATQAAVEAGPAAVEVACAADSARAIDLAVAEAATSVSPRRRLFHDEVEAVADLSFLSAVPDKSEGAEQPCSPASAKAFTASAKAFPASAKAFPASPKAFPKASPTKTPVRKRARTKQPDSGVASSAAVEPAPTAEVGAPAAAELEQAKPRARLRGRGRGRGRGRAAEAPPTDVEENGNTRDSDEMINGEGRSAAPKAKAKAKAGGGRGRGRGQPVQLQEDLPLEWLRDEGMMQHIVRVIMETRRLDFEQLKNDLQTRKDVTLDTIQFSTYWTRCAVGLKTSALPGTPQVCYITINGVDPEVRDACNWNMKIAASFAAANIFVSRPRYTIIRERAECACKR